MSIVLMIFLGIVLVVGTGLAGFCYGLWQERRRLIQIVCCLVSHDNDMLQTWCVDIRPDGSIVTATQHENVTLPEEAPLLVAEAYRFYAAATREQAIELAMVDIAKAREERKMWYALE